ncbi:8f74d80c-9d20-4583-b429-502a4e2bdbf8 [Thermothielavioides terrestris]|jgi:hypothetical protein|uniref:Aminoglycoside phosphotransferase domain-containing protein n=2 Tax=Thermothielavioides terrestris TaxID=2587410 RepID=G2QQV6_THETT|nr:uncharacterized protein THITE_2085620 [Thermothielavioides terrestris NRRL 8126]AEO64115.1 hypothetical protein THITE_2085620 [Thermothielavioides terrestris NRRL 8126]SPQ27031.1 8f74d80c-9d20-4583-b429-502a4e2bdbf8 [Thermothielavioides terrestris]
MDTLLSLDLGFDDCLYRIRRVSGTVNRVLYVTVTNLAIIPEEKRTYGPSVIKELSKLKEWNGDWKTLTVHMDGDRIWCETNAFLPHTVPKKHLLDIYPTYDLFSLELRRPVTHRVFEVSHEGRSCYLKIARFPHELRYLTRELDAYHALALADTGLAPKLLGYVFEETPDRVVGFLVESLEGRAAGVGDLESCREALHKLHRVLLHGDLCKYNIIITPDGPKFIDFEMSTPAADATGALLEEENEKLESQLADESGTGRPWYIE